MNPRKQLSWQEFTQSKIIAPEQLEERVAALRAENKTLATLNGSFDLLHAGHLYIIYEASRTADVLLVAINSDLSVKSYKGESRPIIALPWRLQMLSALAFVDYVTWFDEIDPRELLKKVRPHVHVNGSEYGENCIEAELICQQGGRLHLVERIPGLATSEIIQEIKRKCV